MNVTLRRRVAAHLERGAAPGIVGSALSELWARYADPRRPFELPANTKVVGVGGTTLGGSGKTPFLLALAQATAARGVRSAVVARCYPQSSTPRRVLPTDHFSVVGDDALWLARALAPSGVPVFVGGERSAALRLAAQLAPLIFLDGVLQAKPRRLDLALLLAEESAPWGSGYCPPLGDLRAAKSRLLDAADLLVVTRATANSSVLPACLPASRAAVFWQLRLEGAETPDGTFVSCAELRGLRLGVLLAVARPARVLASLRAAGVEPCEVRLFGDHQPFDRQLRSTPRAGPVAAWLVTDKCRIKLGNSWCAAPVWRLRMRPQLPAALLERVLQLAQGEPSAASNHFPLERP